MVLEPALNWLVLSVAAPSVKATGPPKGWPLAKNWTLPVGVVAAGATGDRMAVRPTLEPWTIGFCDVVNATVELAGVIVRVPLFSRYAIVGQPVIGIAQRGNDAVIARRAGSLRVGRVGGGDVVTGQDSGQGAGEGRIVGAIGFGAVARRNAQGGLVDRYADRAVDRVVVVRCQSAYRSRSAGPSRRWGPSQWRSEGEAARRGAASASVSVEAARVWP